MPTNPNSFQANDIQTISQSLPILSLQPRDKAAILMVNSKIFVSKTIIENGVYFPAERKAFVPDHQHGRHELRCKTVIFIWKDKGPEKVVKGRVKC